MRQKKKASNRKSQRINIDGLKKKCNLTKNKNSRYTWKTHNKEPLYCAAFLFDSISIRTLNSTCTICFETTHSTQYTQYRKTERKMQRNGKELSRTNQHTHNASWMAYHKTVITKCRWIYKCTTFKAQVGDRPENWTALYSVFCIQYANYNFYTARKRVHDRWHSTN